MIYLAKAAGLTAEKAPIPDKHTLTKPCINIDTFLFSAGLLEAFSCPTCQPYASYCLLLLFIDLQTEKEAGPDHRWRGNARDLLREVDQDHQNTETEIETETERKPSTKAKAMRGMSGTDSFSGLSTMTQWYLCFGNISQSVVLYFYFLSIVYFRSPKESQK